MANRVRFATLLPVLFAVGCGDPKLAQLEKSRLGLGLASPVALQVTDDARTIVSVHRRTQADGTAAGDKAYVWDLAKPAEPQRVVELGVELGRPAVSFDGRWLAGEVDPFANPVVLRVWDLRSGQVARDFSPVAAAGKPSFWCGAFSNDGYLVFGESSGDGESKSVLSLWNPADGGLVRRQAIDGNGGGSVAFARDGRSFLVFDGGGCKLHRTADGSLSHTVNLHEIKLGEVFSQSVYDQDEKLRPGTGSEYLKDLRHAAVAPDGSWVALTCVRQARISSEAGEFEYSHPTEVVWIQEFGKGNSLQVVGGRRAGQYGGLAVFPDGKQVVLGVPSQGSTSENRLHLLEENATLQVLSVESIPR
jgi:hypothetical protein